MSQKNYLVCLFDNNESDAIKTFDTLSKTGSKVTILSLPEYYKKYEGRYEFNVEFIENRPSDERSLSETFRSFYESSVSSERKSLINEINHLYSEHISKIVAILEAVNNNINDETEVILVGGNPSINILPLFAFGGIEEKHKILFNFYLLYNKIISDNFASCTYFFKDSSFKIFIQKKIRVYLIFALVSILTLVKFLKKVEFSFKRVKTRAIFPIRTIHQINSLYSLINQLNKDNSNASIILHEGLTAKGVTAYARKKFNSNLDIINTFTLNNLPLFIYTSALCILKIFVNSILTRKATFDYRGFSIELYVNELSANQFSMSYYEFYKRVLKKIINSTSQTNVLISSEMKGRTLFNEYSAAKEKGKGLRVFNIQTAAMNAEYIPYLFLTDKFYLDSKSLLEQFSKLYNNDYNLNFSGSFKYLDIKDSSEISSTIGNDILFFTQPYEHEINNKILNIILAQCPQTTRRISVKLHPRDNIKKYINDERITYMSEQNLSNEELILDHDIIIGKTTSLLHDSIILGKYTVPCLFSNTDKSFKLDYLNTRLNAYSENDLIQKLQDKDVNLFIEVRQEYLNNLGYNKFNLRDELLTQIEAQ